jgi:hypothetical protein
MRPARCALADERTGAPTQASNFIAVQKREAFDLFRGDHEKGVLDCCDDRPLECLRRSQRHNGQVDFLELALLGTNL